MHYISRVAGVLAALGLAAAAGFSILLAVADFDFRTGTPQGVARAAALLPHNTAYLSLRALQVEYDGGDSRPLLERITELDRLSSAPRIRLGLDAEVRGDTAGAERWLLAAAGVDRQFEPRWTLANFYFRQQRSAEFWKWVRAALEVSYGDRRPVFDLCWQVSTEAAQIWSLAIPDRPEVVQAYLGYVLSEHHLEAALPAALKLAKGKNPDDLPLLHGAMDALLEAGSASDAREIWEALGYPRPAGIVSPDFDAPRIGHGFDWRFLAVAGVTHVVLDSPPAHRVVLRGQEPESCELLRQYVLLQPGRRYVLRWESRTAGFPRATGLAWNLAGQHGALLATQDWSPGQIVGQAISSPAILSLTYQRPQGEVRAEGQLELRHVTLTETAQ
jgi:hypothetical protein